MSAAIAAVAVGDGRGDWRGPFLSLGLHLLAGAVLIVLPLAGRPLPPVVEPVAVEIVSPPSHHAAMRPQPQPLAVAPRPSDTPQAPVARPPSAPAALAPPDEMVRPQRMLSEAALSGPRSRAAREKLRGFAPEERVIQLCNVEAMQQVHAWDSGYSPATVIPYALKNLKMRGDAVLADGAAFYSGRDWYRLRYECDVVADKVVSFAFAVGKVIPRGEWQDYDLVAPVADDDD